MWFWLSLIALLCWSGSDLFSKIGCRDARDKYSHLKMVMAVGVVMGLHAAYEVFVGGTVINLDIILTYLPVSILYILSMAMGYVGLRYIELSISSPICNTSGALVAIASILFLGSGKDMVPMQFVAVALACLGVVALGIVDARVGRNPSRRPASSVQLQIRQILAGFGASCRLLPPGRRRYLCRQSGSGAFGRSLCQCGL